MLDPRTLTERRDEILESCRLRRVRADVDEAIAAHAQVTAHTTELNELNRVRNEHQKGGKKKLSGEEREAHVAEGRRLKDGVGELEQRIRAATEARDDQLDVIPNYIHPDVPEGGEEDFKLRSTWGEVPKFEFEPRDHLAICDLLDLADLEHGASVAVAGVSRTMRQLGRGLSWPLP